MKFELSQSVDGSWVLSSLASDIRKQLATFPNTQAMLIGISSMIAVSLEPAPASGDREIAFSERDV